jgi:FlaA1/EpsC-like NDP-sugar epimerase
MTQRSSSHALVNPAIATLRDHSLFAEDISAHHDAIAALVRNKRVLAIGGAGSIGSATTTTLSDFAPSALHVVDQNENALAELVRQFRSRADPFEVEDFRTLPLDYGSMAMRTFLAQQPAYDLILNFAAIKHVRSEKDPFSTLQMFDTNIVKQYRFMGWLDALDFKGRYFSVSTDKAANPSSLMGATKRVMEHIMFDNEAGARPYTVVTARFANVAFSNGSLLESFTKRLALGQPVAAPQDIRRYFVSLEESGQICTLAATLAPDRHIAIPNLDPETHLVPLSDVAKGFLRDNGYEPHVHNDEAVACRAVEADRAKGRWPLLLTPGNTAGEKPYEEFVASTETVSDIGLSQMKGISYVPTSGSIGTMIVALESYISELGIYPKRLTTDALKAFIAQLEPAFLDTHVQSALNLDQRA